MISETPLSVNMLDSGQIIFALLRSAHLLIISVSRRYLLNKHYGRNSPRMVADYNFLAQMRTCVTGVGLQVEHWNFGPPNHESVLHLFVLQVMDSPRQLSQSTRLDRVFSPLEAYYCALRNSGLARQTSSRELLCFCPDLI
jgi:hypothetical protein